MSAVLNLDPLFHPYETDVISFESFIFKGGESHIRIPDPVPIKRFLGTENVNLCDIDEVVITTRIRTGDDVMKLLLAKDALERLGVKNIDLIIPYLPYARQDRVCNEGESFSLKVFTNLINSLKFNEVTVFDSHSDVGPALIDRCNNVPNIEFVRIAVTDINQDNLVLVSPDSGANKKVNKLFDSLEGKFDGIVKCDKKRNLKDQSLKGFEVFTDDLQGKPCLIVDDICDGGRTFVGIAEELKKKNAGDLYLFVSHGIFSYGFDELEKHFKKIYTTNSFSDITHPLVEQFNLSL